MLTLSAATWVRMRWRWKRGTTIIWEKMAGRRRSSALNRRRNAFPCGGPNWRPIIESLAPYLVEHLVALDQGCQRRFEGESGLVGPFDDVLFVEGGQSGEAGHHGQLVASKGARVLERLLE